MQVEGRRDLLPWCNHSHLCSWCNRERKEITKPLLSYSWAAASRVATLRVLIFSWHFTESLSHSLTFILLSSWWIDRKACHLRAEGGLNMFADIFSFSSVPECYAILLLWVRFDGRSSFYPPLANMKWLSHIKTYKERATVEPWRLKNSCCNYSRHSRVGTLFVLWDAGCRWTTQVCNFEITPVCLWSFSWWLSYSWCLLYKTSRPTNGHFHQQAQCENVL